MSTLTDARRAALEADGWRKFGAQWWRGSEILEENAARFADVLIAEMPQEPVACYDCGRSYGNEHGFPDLVVPHGVWKKISPTGDEGGLLCPSCICKRAYEAGISGVRVAFRSGPFAVWEEPSPNEEPTDD